MSTQDELSCFHSAFCADDTPIEIVPSFDLEQIPLLSSTSAGPFKAGMLQSVPLWFALTLHQRSLCTISLPAWLSAENLTDIIAAENKQAGLFHDESRLPAAYFEIAKRLTTAMTDKAVLPLLVQDLLSVRLDKLRQQFQHLFAESAAVTDLLVAVTGIGTQELAVLRQFVQQALNDQNYLLQGNTGDSTTSAGTGAAAAAAAAAGGGGETDKPLGASSGDGDEKAAVRARVPLRRFRR